MHHCRIPPPNFFVVSFLLYEGFKHVTLVVNGTPRPELKVCDVFLLHMPNKRLSHEHTNVQKFVGNCSKGSQRINTMCTSILNRITGSPVKTHP